MKNISMLINTADKRSHINPEIYGHFSRNILADVSITECTLAKILRYRT